MTPTLSITRMSSGHVEITIVDAGELEDVLQDRGYSFDGYAIVSGDFYNATTKGGWVKRWEAKSNDEAPAIFAEIITEIDWLSANGGATDLTNRAEKTVAHFRAM